MHVAVVLLGDLQKETMLSSIPVTPLHPLTVLSVLVLPRLFKEWITLSSSESLSGRYNVLSTNTFYPLDNDLSTSYPVFYPVFEQPGPGRYLPTF